MKRFLFLLVAIQIAFVSFGQNDDKSVIILKVISTDETVMKEIEQARAIIQIEAFFQKALKEEYSVRLVDPDSENAFALIRNTELKNNRFYRRDYDIDTPRRSRLKVASYLCLVEISKNNNGEYILAAKIGDTETAELIESALYPEFKDIPLKSLDREPLQRACLFLISRLRLIEMTAQDIIDAEKKAKQDIIDAKEKAKNKMNAIALGWSIIPGVGLMRKGHTGEGVAYLLGDIALVGGGVGMLAYANKQQRIMNDRNTTFDQYNTAKNNYNTAKTVSYCCFGAAAALYVVNLVRGYVAPNENPNFHVDIVPGMMSAISPYGPNMSVNLALSYKF